MFEIEFSDTKIPMIEFLRTITKELLKYLKFIGKAFLQLFDPTKWTWVHWVFSIIIIIILILMIINNLVGSLNGFWIYKSNIFLFLISILIFIYFIIIVVSYVYNLKVVTEYDIINQTLKYIQYLVALMFLGIIFSIILAPKGIEKLTNPLIYIKDCLLIIFVLSLILFSYNMIILVVLE